MSQPTETPVTLVKLSAKRSGAGLVVVGTDAAGTEHRLTGVVELVLLDGEVKAFQSGATVGFQPSSLPA
jgi:hypothetical protein